jgi:hypothetical protein
MKDNTRTYTLNKLFRSLYDSKMIDDDVARKRFKDELHKAGRFPANIRVEDISGKNISIESVEQYPDGTKMITAYTAYAGKKTAPRIDEVSYK